MDNPNQTGDHHQPLTVERPFSARLESRPRNGLRTQVNTNTIRWFL